MDWIFHFHSMGLFLYREILCYPTPINFNYWYGIGLLLVFLLVNQVLTGVVFLELQLKEYTAAFFTFSDSTFGSDFYGTTCLHGLHVTTGSLGFGIL